MSMQFDPSFSIRRGAKLPHWTRDGAIYAVTFRLGDSLPRGVRENIEFEREVIVKTAKQMRRPLNEDETARLLYLYSNKVEQTLNAGYGACWMQNERVASVVRDTLKFFDGRRYELIAWCVMPNHVHVVVKPLMGYPLSKILHSWKSFTAHEANKVLSRSGGFWEAEYFDHLVRNDEDLGRGVRYVLENPESAGLKDWKWVGCKNNED